MTPHEGPGTSLPDILGALSGGCRPRAGRMETPTTAVVMGGCWAGRRSYRSHPPARGAWRGTGDAGRPAVTSIGWQNRDEPPLYREGPYVGDAECAGQLQPGGAAYPDGGLDSRDPETSLPPI